MRSAMTASAFRATIETHASAVEEAPRRLASAPRAVDLKSAPAFSSVEIHRDFATVASEWSALLGQALAGPYQDPAFLAAWARNAAAAEGATPVIALARDARGQAVALLPFCATRHFGVTVARFLGGSHVNYNMAVIRRDRLEAFAAGEAERLLAETAAAARFDSYHLVNQPVAWMGTHNPLGCLPSQPSPDQAYSGPLAASVEEHLNLHVSAKARANQRRKMRRFEEHGTPHLYRAETSDQRRRLLDAYFAQKAEQFAARGIDNVFERPGVRAFLDEACGLGETPATVNLYGFEVMDEILAVHGGVADGRRHCGMFNSITSGELSKYSPGEILMNFVVEEQIRRGLTSFDLGVGAAAYKKTHCPDVDQLFDSIYGVTLKGRAVAACEAAATALKARIKATPWAYGLIGKVRKARAALNAPQSPEAAD